MACHAKTGHAPQSCHLTLFSLSNACPRCLTNITESHAHKQGYILPVMRAMDPQDIPCRLRTGVRFPKPVSVQTSPMLYIDRNRHAQADTTTGRHNPQTAQQASCAVHVMQPAVHLHACTHHVHRTYETRAVKRTPNTYVCQCICSAYRTTPARHATIEGALQMQCLAAACIALHMHAC
jgi:hypothetical protein